MNKLFIHKEGNATMVLVAIPVGSYYENEKYKGISHFLEHMCFKGTQSRTRKEIDGAIEGIGGIINAFTDTEITCYWAKVANKYKDIAIEVITDLACNPSFPEKEIDKEREVIIQELKMGLDDTDCAVADLYNEIYYPKEHGLHTSIIGTQESLYRINRDELIHWHNTYYDNATLIVIGDVKDKAEFLPEHSYICDFKVTSNKIYHPKHTKHLEKRKQEQAHIMMGNDVVLPLYDKVDKNLLVILLKSIFNGMSGRLFETIREKNNLVYGIYFDVINYSGNLLTWTVNLSLEKNKIDKARNLIEKELMKTVTAEELKFNLIKAIGSHALAIDSVTTVAQTIAYCLRKGVDYTPFITDFEPDLRRVSGKVNEFIKAMNFKENLLVGYVPK
jgi:predicted Zn-dependent peptidase